MRINKRKPRRCGLCFHRTVAVQHGGKWQVQCPDCGTHNHGFGTRQLAVAAWNRLG